MTYEGAEERRGVPHKRRIVHYHGDEVRILFFTGALVLIVAQSTGANLPLSTMGAVFMAILLVIAAGITSPTQRKIHWFNACVAILGTLVFGTTAVEHYRQGLSIFDSSFTFVEALAIISLISLYYTTRTIRGYLQRPGLE